MEKSLAPSQTNMPHTLWHGSRQHRQVGGPFEFFFFFFWREFRCSTLVDAVSVHIYPTAKLPRQITDWAMQPEHNAQLVGDGV